MKDGFTVYVFYPLAPFHIFKWQSMNFEPLARLLIKSKTLRPTFKFEWVQIWESKFIKWYVKNKIKTPNVRLDWDHIEFAYIKYMLKSRTSRCIVGKDSTLYVPCNA